MLQQGDTFLLPNHANDVEHLWIIVTPVDEEGKAVCVNVTTLRSTSSFVDMTTVLKPGDHPFISQDSVVRYSDASILDINLLERAIDGKEGNLNIVCRKLEPCSPQLLKRIKNDILESDYTRRDIQEKCRVSLSSD